MVEDVRRSRQHGRQPLDDMRGARVRKTKEDDASGPVTGQNREIAKLEIEGKNDTILGDGTREDLGVRGSAVHPELSEVDGIVSVLAQPLDDAYVHAHVSEKAHAARLRDSDFLARQPGGVLDRLLDVLPFEVGVAGKDLLEARTMSDLPHDHRDRNSHSADARPPTHDLRIERDAVEHGTPPFLAATEQGTALVLARATTRAAASPATC